MAACALERKRRRRQIELARRAPGLVASVSPLARGISEREPWLCDRNENGRRRIFGVGWMDLQDSTKKTLGDDVDEPQQK